MPSITLGQFIDNMEKNGLPQIRGQFFLRIYEEDHMNLLVKVKEVKGACALGQGLWNTFPHTETDPPSGPQKFWDQIESIVDESEKEPLFFTQQIIRWNDDEQLPLAEIVKLAREKYASQLDTVIEWKD